MLLYILKSFSCFDTLFIVLKQIVSIFLTDKIYFITLNGNNNLFTHSVLHKEPTDEMKCEVHVYCTSLWKCFSHKFITEIYFLLHFLFIITSSINFCCCKVFKSKNVKVCMKMLIIKGQVNNVNY